MICAQTPTMPLIRHNLLFFMFSQQNALKLQQNSLRLHSNFAQTPLKLWQNCTQAPLKLHLNVSPHRIRRSQFWAFLWEAIELCPNRDAFKVLLQYYIIGVAVLWMWPTHAPHLKAHHIQRHHIQSCMRFRLKDMLHWVGECRCAKPLPISSCNKFVCVDVRYSQLMNMFMFHQMCSRLRWWAKPKLIYHKNTFCDKNTFCHKNKFCHENKFSSKNTLHPVIRISCVIRIYSVKEYVLL